MSEDQAVDVDAVYRERAQLVAHLAAIYPSVMCESDDPAYALVYVVVPTGQLSWHVAERDYDLFRHVQKSMPVRWDGHTTEEKYERLAAYTQQRAHYALRL
jgi:hypothetical protein